MLRTRSKSPRTTQFFSAVACLLAISFLASGFAYAHPLDDLPAGHWVEIPNTNLEQVFPASPPPGNTGPRSVMLAWSGGAFDTTRDRLIVWGGGHADYSGNELYTFDVDTLSWTRLTAPSSDVGGSESSGVYPDGRPRSRHTYGNIVYAASADKFISLGGMGLYPSGQIGDSKTHLFDFETNQWSLGQSVTSVGWRYGATSFDPVTGKVFYFGGGSSGRFASYDPVNNSVAYHASRGAEIYAVAALDPVRRNMVVVGGYGGTAQLFKLDLDNPNAAPVNLLPLSSGDTTMESKGGIGFVFDPVSDKFVAWDGGSSVYTLDPDTWEWNRVNAASGNTTTPTAAEPNGTYGRFQYIPSRNAFVAVNRTNENVYFYKLTNAGGQTSGPALSFTASAVTVDSGAEVSLSWSSPAATSCQASGDWSGARATEGSETVGPLVDSVSFALTCSNGEGSTSRSVSVSVTPPPDTQAPSVPGGLSGEAVSSSQINLSWNASTDTGGSGVSGYQVYRNGSEIGSSSSLSYVDNFLDAETTYQYSVLAFDSAGNASQLSADLAVTTQAADPGNEGGVRVNAGGGAYTDTTGQVWSADTGFNTGSVASRSYAIDGTLDDELFQTERWDGDAAPELMYSFAVANGSYTVNLLFAEFYEGAFSVGARVFDVAIEDQLVLDNLDVFAEVGSNSALYKSFPVTVADGQLNIELLHQVDNPKISAIEILPADSVPPASPTVTLNADPLTVTSGDSSTLSWSSSNASSCVASGGWSGSKGTSGSQSVGPLSANSTFVLTCSGAGGSASDSVAVQVNDPPADAPTVTLNADPLTVTSGDSSTLSWSSSNASSCVASGGWSGSKGTSGSQSVGPLSANSTFVLTCSGAGGSASDSVAVQVNDPPADAPTLSFTISPDVIPLGESGTLSWASDNATSCVASGDWSGSKSTSGSESVGPVTAESSYTLTCSGAGGSVTRTVDFTLLDNDADSDGLPDDWEQQYFGNLDQSPAGDFDSDGLSNGQEYQLGTDPTDSDTDGDGESDYDETVYGSDPNDSGDTWQAHRPYKPVVAAQGVVALRDHIFDVAEAYADPDGDALSISEWQVSADAGFSALMMYRGVFEQTAVPTPLGVLLPSEQYWVRTRHRDSNGLPSEWSDAVPFSTAAAYPNDTDGNGIDDDYQVDGFVDTNANGVADGDEGMCNMYDAQSRSAIGFETTAGTLQCFTSMGDSDLPQTNMPDGGLPYGTFTFMVSGLPVDAENPATISVTIHFPEDLDPNTTWYKYDEAIEDYADFSANASVNGNSVTLTLTDGGDGDQDGVVNGVIVDPSGPTNTSAVSSSGGGAAGWLSLLLLVVMSGLRRTSQAVAINAVSKGRRTTLQRWFAAAFVSGFAIASANAAVVTGYELNNKSSSTQLDVPVTVGQVFKPGDVPSGAELVLKGPAGVLLPSQVDAKAVHADGSLRHAVVTAVVPVLAGGAQQSLSLETAAGAVSGPAVSASGLLATGFDAEVLLNVGGTTYSLSARDLLQSGDYQTWLSGPLVSEWIVGGAVKNASGTAHSNLAAYFHVRAYAGYERVRVDVVIENGWTFVSGASDKSYSVDVVLNGASVYQQSINHFNHARWHKQFWAGSQPNIYVQHDVNYLQASGAIPTYADLTPSAGYLNGLMQTSTPMDNGDFTVNFGDTGAQPQIGPLPRWASTYAVSGDERAYRNMLANDDSAGTYEAHFRDQLTGKPVSVVDHPNATLQDSSVPAGPSSNPYNLDQAHQPSVGFLSYLVTGDYFYLEETQFWTAWNLLSTNAPYRGFDKGIFVIQVRGQAWALRNLGQAAYITPDDDPLKADYAHHLYHNADVRIQDYSPGGSRHNNLGVIQGYDGNQSGSHKPWMDDFFTFAVGYLVQLGFSDYVPLRDFKVQYPIGRMDTADYCYIRAAEYAPGVGPSSNTWYASFAEMYQANWGANTSCPEGQAMNGYPDVPSGYTANMRPALVMAANSGAPGAQAGWERFLNSAVHPDFNNYPNWALVPSSAGGQTSGPALSFTASAVTVDSGAEVSLSWSSPAATSCQASGDWSGARATEGSETVGPLLDSVSFALTCSNGEGSTSRSVSVSVTPPPDTQAPSVPGGLSGEAVSSSQINLSWNASTDTGGSGVSGYQVYRNGSEIGSSSSLSYVDNFLDAETTYQYSVLAFDSAGNASQLSADLAVTTQAADPGNEGGVRVNAGGGAYTDNTGQVWSADTGFNTGSVASRSYAIDGTLDDELFQTERWDGDAAPELMYSFAVANGSYTVNLLFAEFYEGAFSVGARVFDVAIEDQLVLDNLDVFAEVGSNSALYKSFPVTVADGQLNIELLHQVDNPKISAIEILPADSVPPASPTVTLNADPLTVTSGDSSTLSWSSSNASSCVASGGWSGSKGTSGSQSVGPLSANSTFVLTCSGAGGSASDSVAVQVNDPPADAPTVTLNADPLTVTSGDSSTLSWSSSNASSCVASGGWSGSKGTSGSQSVGPLSANSTFVLTCSGAGGSASDSVAVQVNDPPADAPTLSFTISPDVIPLGESGTLSWASDNATSCVASGDWSGSKSTSGSESVGPVTAESSYTLTCSGAGGSVTRTVDFTLLDNDADSDGLPDDWEQQYFGNLDQSPAGDFDSDGLSNGQEYQLGTDPTDSDTDGDGESDYDETVYGSDPNDSGDTWQAHRPYKPVVAAQGVVALRDHIFDVAEAYADPDGDALSISEWQVSADAGFSALMMYRGVFEQTAVPTPLGVLLPSEQYWVRTRHRDSNGLPSEWSDAVPFSTAAAYPNDTDGNGIDDDYQVDGFVDTNANGVADGDEGMCNMYDAQSRSAIGFETTAGTLQCFTSMGDSDLPQTNMPDGGLPYGTFTFMVSGLPVDAENPATISVTIHFPEDLDPNTTWYKYDEAIEDYADFSANASVNGNSVTLTLTDGGDGDQDGVVNGVIVDPSGPANTQVTAPSGGGAPGWAILCLFGLGFRLRAKKAGD